MKQQFSFFVLRWFINSIALWIAVRILSSGDFASTTAGFTAFLVTGLLLSIVNATLRPIIVILALPAILLTLGLFMLVVNGILVGIAIALVPSIQVTPIGAVLTGMVVSLANYVVSGIMERYSYPKEFTHHASR